jgi:hypothetical protein
MSIQRWMKCSAVTSVLLFSINCMGPRYAVGTKSLPVEKLAILHNEGDSFYVIGVDGIDRGPGLFSEYRLLPGSHVVTCRTVDTLYGELSVGFTATAGKHYVMRGNFSDSEKKWNFEILEKGTNNVVSGPSGRPEWHDPHWD